MTGKRWRSTPETKAARREEILKAAEAVFVEKGMASATMLDVARRAKVSKETLYAEFGNKELMIAAMIHHHIERLPEAPGRLATAPAESAEDIERTLEGYAEMLVALLMRKEVVELHRYVVAEQTKNPRAVVMISEGGMKTTREPALAYLERVLEKGLLNYENAEDALSTLEGLAIGLRYTAVLLGVMEPNPEKAHELARKAVERFMILGKTKA